MAMEEERVSSTDIHDIWLFLADVHCVSKKFPLLNSL